MRAAYPKIYPQISARLPQRAGPLLGNDALHVAGAWRAPPPHLSPASRAWFAEIISGYELESQHVRLLTLACEAWDRGTLARETLAEHGLTFLDRFGSPHARPEVAIARDATIAVARLCRELDLDADAMPATPRPPALNSNRRN